MDAATLADRRDRMPGSADGPAPRSATRLDPVPYVFAFDHKHRQPPMDMKDLLGGKGANLAEMTSVLDLPVPPGLHHHHRRLPRLHGTAAGPTGSTPRSPSTSTKLEKTMGRTLGDPADPLLVSVRSGAKFSMPGMMDTVLNLGLNDESVEGLAEQTGDERFAYDSYRRFIAMYGRIVLDIDGEPFDAPARDGQGAGRRRRPTPTSRPTTLRRAVRALQGRRRASTPASRSRRTRRRSCGAPSRRCSARGTAPGPSPTASASASATTSAPP